MLPAIVKNYKLPFGNEICFNWTPPSIISEHWSSGRPPKRSHPHYEELISAANSARERFVDEIRALCTTGMPIGAQGFGITRSK